jgi:hypothetical protein
MPVEAGALREAHLRACTEALLRADHPRMDCLRAARELALPDWALGAGFVRNLIWDHLHDKAEPTPLNDIDLIYLDSADPTGLKEADHEAWLAARMPGQQWEVRNQARMHRASGASFCQLALGPQPLGGGAHLHRGPPAGR